jgi:hypothetical protein
MEFHCRQSWDLEFEFIPRNWIFYFSDHLYSFLPGIGGQAFIDDSSTLLGFPLITNYMAPILIQH